MSDTFAGVEMPDVEIRTETVELKAGDDIEAIVDAAKVAYVGENVGFRLVFRCGENVVESFEKTADGWRDLMYTKLVDI